MALSIVYLQIILFRKIYYLQSRNQCTQVCSMEIIDKKEYLNAFAENRIRNKLEKKSRVCMRVFEIPFKNTIVIFLYIYQAHPSFCFLLFL